MFPCNAITVYQKFVSKVFLLVEVNSFKTGQDWTCDHQIHYSDFVSVFFSEREKTENGFHS